MHQGDMGAVIAWEGNDAVQHGFSEFIKTRILKLTGKKYPLSVPKTLHEPEFNPQRFAEANGSQVLDDRVKRLNLIFPAQGDVGGDKMEL